MVGELLHLVKRVASLVLEPFMWPVQLLRDQVMAAPVLSLLIMLALLWCIVKAIGGDRMAAAMLLPLSFVWVLFNGPFEGPVLLVLSWSHGVTAADFLSLFALLVAAWRLTPAVVGR